MTELKAEDRLIAAPSQSAKFWLEWINQLPPENVFDPCQLFLESSRLVVVAPHPDDELLMGGALIQAALAKGMDIALVAVTEGEACFGPSDDGAEIARLRRAERCDGLKALGADGASVHYLCIPDGKVADHCHDLRQALSALLTPIDLVLTTWNLDGHPDHEATGRCVADVAKTVGCRVLESPVWMWHWATPNHPSIPWAKLCVCHCSAEASQRKVAALYCHQSQIETLGATTPVVDEALLARARWPVETYFISELRTAHE